MAAPLNDQNNSAFGRTSDSAGNSVPAPLATTFNQQLKPLLDDNGRLIVRVADQGGFVNPGILTRFTSGAARAPLVGTVVEAVPLLQLDSIWGYNGNALLQFFLHIYDLAVLPTTGVSTPDYIVPVPPGFTTFSFSDRIALATGYTVAASITEFIFTPLVATDLWFATNYYI